MKSYYVTSKGEKVATREEAGCLRIDCDCGHHRVDVPVAQIDDQSLPQAKAYFAMLHPKPAKPPKEAA